MKILLLETFFTGSHRKWAEEFQRFSKHEIEILSLSGNHWKWRMHGGAITLASKASAFIEKSGKVDLVLASDMIDLSLFLSLTRKWSHDIPTAVYFHENQLNYPWSPTDADVKLERDNHYAFINYSSALAADKVLFNSQYHHDAFLGELPKFLKAFPDNNNSETVEAIREKSSVLPLALDLKKFDEHKPAKIDRPNRAVVLWNHRWEYDKHPAHFFNALFQLADHGIDFRLVVLGESYEKRPPVFDEAKEKLADKILHFSYAESFDEYCKWLWTADLLPVTSSQDFFGGSVIEAMYCNVVPFLPKRLAYPEHIPAQFHSTFFYDEEDFVAKLQRRIMDVKYLRVMDTQQYARKYDWSNLIEVYDEDMIKVAR
jgi:glycosyltransferase involved in cell wall biosynthesis